MKLYYSATSPFARKVLVSALELGIDKRIELVPTNAFDPLTDLGQINPLGKVPALVLDDGHVVFDSPVICEYIDELVPGIVLFPAAGKARWKALHFQALSDGMSDAGILVLLEGRRVESEKSQSWIDRQMNAINRSLDCLEKEIDELSGGPLTIGQISVACSLGWIQFRLADDKLLASRPKLAKWFETFSARPSMVATVPKA
jgi:glutathione S-transferase